MADGRGQGHGPIENGRGYLVNLAAILLVGGLLLSNLLALGLSIPIVLENAGRTYEASTSGELVLPFYPDGSSVCYLEAPSFLEEGVPFNVTLTFGSGERPYTIPFIVLRSALGELRFRLWDSWTPGGDWRGWTRVPGLEGGANWTVRAWSGWDRYVRTTPGGGLESYGGFNGNHPYRCNELGASARIFVAEGRASFLLPMTGDDLSLDQPPVFREVKRMEVGMGSPAYSLYERGGRSYPLVHLGGSLFGPQDNTSLNHSWSEFNIQYKYTNALFIPKIRYQRGFLLKSGCPASLDARNISLTLGTVLDHKDSLYELETRVTVDGRSGNLTLMEGTYYNILLSLDQIGNGPWWYPTSELIVAIGEMRYPLASTGRIGVWKGYILTPIGYGSEGRLDLVVACEPWPTNLTSVLNHRTYLSKNPTPDLELSTDPFSLPFNNDIGDVQLTFRGDWELVNWRLFRAAPTVEAGGDPQGMLEVVEDYEYNDTVRWRGNGTIWERTLNVSATTHFEPSETVLLVLRLKGPILLGWFCLVTAAIIVSCSVLLGRGLRPLLKGGLKHLEANMRPVLLNTDNDMLATFRTYSGALFFSITVVILFQLMEQPTPVPDLLSEGTPVWMQMVALANASVWEEIVSRVLMIGFPMSVFALMNQGVRPAVKALMGGHGRVPVQAGALIFLSATLFGLAHIGWGPWKVVPTFIMGLLFGYLYVKIGLHASISLHFLFDYSGFLSDLTGRDGSYIWTLLFYFTMIAGGALLADVLVRAVGWFKRGPFNPTHRIEFMAYHFLIAHALMALFFAIVMFLYSREFVYGAMMLIVPLMDGIAFFLRRRIDGPLPKVMVYVSSLMTLPAAPLGMAWAISDGQGPEGE